MSIRCVSLLAAAALAGLAAPAVAQQYGPPPLPLPAPVAQGDDWDDGDWDEEDVYVNDDGNYDEREWADHHPARADGPPPLGVAQPQPLGYSPEQRTEWLEQCRAAYDGRGERRGQVIGGVLGAGVGAV